ncbi:MAG TPA: succinyl-diaminopimelate desuccinylase [Acidimicrobiia bacterium]|nr:succinyl-diaminopimelate desuccinylase [Acidimicrobiia bacterium]
MSAADVLTHDAADLFGLTAALVGVRSESHHEAELAATVEERVRARAPSLAVDRVGQSVIARTQFGRSRRVVLGGHLDTVPANGNETPRVEGDVLHGLGSADMKGGIAVLLRLAEELHERPQDARHDVTFAFYECEEVADRYNGLRLILEAAPDVLVGDFAVLLEPTDAWVEAGCQGVIVLEANFEGERAHTARPWMGRNAIHRAAEVLGRLALHESETVVVDGLEYRESLQVVRVEGGIEGKHNVVPDSCRIVVGRRFAPSYTIGQAEAQVRALLDEADSVAVLQAQPAAPPNLADPLVSEFVDGLGLLVRPKLGWTDVARFASRGVPAVNFGPGDPEIAHTAGELVTRDSIERAYGTLAAFVGVGALRAGGGR